MNAPILLELFGINHSYRYQLVKQMLVDALDSTGANYKIEDVSQIDKFIEEGLQSVPAIRVDHDKLFSISLTEDPNITVESVFQYIVRNKLKSILVPTDFSDQSINALQYAGELSKNLGMRIELLHVHHPVVDPHNAVVLDSDMGTYRKEQLERVAQNFIDQQPQHAGFVKPITTRFEIGYPLPNIIEISKEPGTGMILMGTLGATNVLDKIFGNVSSSVASQADVPVMLIPPNAQFKTPRHIMVAFDAELVEDGCIGKLMSFNESFKAHIDFVHVADKGADFEVIRNKLMNQLLTNGDVTFSFDIREISHASDIAGQLESYAAETDPDIIAVIARHRSFVQRMFHKSISKTLFLHTHRPTLVLHVD